MNPALISTFSCQSYDYYALYICLREMGVYVMFLSNYEQIDTTILISINKYK